MASMRLASECEGDLSTEAKRSRQNDGNNVDLHNCPPSRVLHVRGLPDYAQIHDLTTAMSVFGHVSHVMMMKNGRQALVEMGDIAQATSLVRASEQAPIYIGGQRIFVNFSRSQEIQRDREMGMGRGAGAGGPWMGRESNPTHILLLTVLNPIYPITTEVLYTISSPIGKVLRIVVMRKHGVQGMVEFDSVETAMRARDALHNADVYPGCCTLKVEFSHADRLNVRRNDEDTWDCTIGMGAPGGDQGRGYGDQGRGYGDQGRGYGEQGRGYGMQHMRQREPPRPMGRGMGAAPGRPPYGMGPGSPGSYMPGPSGPGPVLMVYGLSMSMMNCDRLFNLLCMYGNVIKIKFLPEKPGTAMAQMSDSFAADVAMDALNEAPMFGSKLEIKRSKHPFIAGTMQQKTLPDGTPAMIEYSESKMNRFLRPDNKNRLYPPSTQLHFFNAPIASTPESVSGIVAEAGGPTPSLVKVFDKDLTRPSTGMLEYSTVETAMEAAAIVNHAKVPTGEGQDTITFKVCFAAARRPYQP